MFKGKKHSNGSKSHSKHVLTSLVIKLSPVLIVQNYKGNQGLSNTSEENTFFSE